VPYVEAAGDARLYFEQEGEGPLVVLVHGGTGTGAYDWEHQRPALARSYRVVTPDLRGHGRSNDPHWLLGLEQIGEDLLRLVDELGERPAAVLAFSIGASAVLRLLTRRPKLTRAFVAIGASTRGDPERVERIVTGPWPAGLIALRHEHGEDADHWQRLRRRLARSWADDQRLGPDELARVALPTLVVCGDRDPIEPVETALELARALPLGELLVAPRAGHFVARERPAELTLAVERFLARALDGATPG
jgi:pimeloyl-ACP methyl ester carboxylesterase